MSEKTVYFKQLSQALRNYYYIPDKELDKISRLFYPCRIKKGEFFVRSGFMADSIGFILSGLLRYYYADRNGVEYTKAFAAENDFAVSYASMLLKKPSAFSIEALENTEMLCIRYSDWEKLLETVPCWNIVARKIMEKVYIMKQLRESELLLEDAQSRYIHFMEQYPLLHKRLKQHYIASYLGISPVSLSRIRKKMRDC